VTWSVPSVGTDIREVAPMFLDIVYVAIAAGAFLGCWWFVIACDRL
jgi:hypothetical protein